MWMFQTQERVAYEEVVKAFECRSALIILRQYETLRFYQKYLKLVKYYNILFLPTPPPPPPPHNQINFLLFIIFIHNNKSLPLYYFF